MAIHKLSGKSSGFREREEGRFHGNLIVNILSEISNMYEVKQ